MSTNDDENGDSGPGRREVAHRIFAAEFDDASLSYSESDEERAPNYVVTPTGARVNRLFAVGVLTEVDAVNEETLRARIADPTGAFVSYAGQYQPDEMAFLDRTTPPAFLALTGKARTFEPEDSNRVFTSVRPESINEVDGDTRDRWVVETARATLQRVRVFAEALETGLTGDDLRAHLESHDVPVSLASGIPLAIDHYGTTTAYLEAVRTLAVETLEVVADERDEASRLDLAPGEGGEVDIGPLPAGESDLSTDVDVAGTAETTETAETVDADETTEATDADETTEATDADDAADIVEATTTAGGTSEDVDSASTTDNESEAATPTTETATTDSVESEETTADDVGDFDAGGSTASTDAGADNVGDFETDTSSDATAETDDTDDADAEDVDPEDLDDVLDDETREEVESEFGVDFATGNEVDDPGEADIDVPDADDLEEMTAEAADGAASADADGASAEVTASSSGESESDADAGEAESDDETDGTQDEGTADAGDVDAEDVDLETAVVEAMKAEDDGSGAPREDVVAAVVAEYGVTESAVEDAVQDALMSGLCYEAADGLKPI